MAANLRKLEAAAWPIFEAGHVPMIGEWVALPVLHSAGVTAMDSLADDVLYPTAQRLLQHCDAVLRLPGESTGGIRTSQPPSGSGFLSTSTSRRSPVSRPGACRLGSAARLQCLLAGRAGQESPLPR
jgi:hypothetical protein